MGKTRKIKLSRGLSCTVDAKNFERLNDFNWYAQHGKYPYARRGQRTKDGKKKTIYMHRVITGARKGQIVDHKDRNVLNMRESNLRITTHRQNCMNRGKLPGCSSKYVGVRKCNGKWRATSPRNRKGKQVHIGYFKTELSAHRARIKYLRGK